MSVFIGMKVSSVFIIFLFILISCGSKENSSQENNQSNQDLLFELPIPSIPEDLDSADIAGFFLEHFWDGLDFTDTLLTHNRDFLEQNFANFSQALIISNDSSARRKGAATLMKKAEADSVVYKMLSEIAYHYLYDPNSPMLDEESFIPFMEIFKDSELLNEAERERNRFLLQNALKNRPGMRAADFTYVTSDGKTTSLYKTPVKRNLLVIFYDPDCDNCKEIIGKLAESPGLREMINQGDISLLAIYSGENKKLWDETAPSLPKEWTVGYNSGSIEDNDDYFFRASPTIYLLDNNKNVLVKDLSPSRLP